MLISSVVQLEVFRRHIVDFARTLSNAPYAALCVSNEKGRTLLFIASGTGAETISKTEPLPQESGLSGAWIHDVVSGLDRGSTVRFASIL